MLLSRCIAIGFVAMVLIELAGMALKSLGMH